MRIAAISDIHGNLPALEAVLADIGRCAVDVTVNLGDIVSGPLWPAETADRLMTLALPTIRGNHERQLLTLARERMSPPGRPKGEYRSAQHEGAPMSPADAYAAERLSALQRQWLESLPIALQLAPGVVCCHGTPDSDLDYWLETVVPGFERGDAPGIRMARAAEARARLGSQRDAKASLRLCGHTHQPRVLDLGAEGLVLNPGSVGLQAYDDARPHLHVVENGSPHARWALAERHGAHWQVEFHAVVYDWEAAARQAEANSRPDWADALRSGFVGRFEADLTGVA